MGDLRGPVAVRAVEGALGAAAGLLRRDDEPGRQAEGAVGLMAEIARATNRTAAEPVPAPAGSALAVRTPMEAARATYEHTLEAKKAYASMLANSGLLPKAYVKNPPNVLFALEYGETLGITPIAAMMGIHVIEGR